MASFFKFILIVFVFIFLSAALFYGALNSHFAWEWGIKKAVYYKWHSSGLSVKTIKVNKPKFDFKELTFKAIEMDLKIKDTIYPITLEGIDIIRGDQKIRARINVLAIKAIGGEIKMASLNAELTQVQNVQQWMGQAVQVSFAPYECGDLDFTVQSHDKTSDIRFNAQCYEGKIEGGIVLDYVKMLSYAGHVNMESFNLDALEKANPEIFSKMNGRLTGGFLLDGKESRIENFDSNIKIDSNGEIKAVLLEPLLNYIPQSTQRKDLELLIQQDGNVPLELAKVTLKKLTAEQMSSEINLASKKLNLNTNLTVEINVEGGIKNLYKQIIDFLKKGVSPQ
jgi:hypothetical protein